MFSISPYTFMVEAQGDPYFLTFPMKEELMSKKTPQSETPNLNCEEFLGPS